MEVNLLEEALKYASYGFYILPCRNRNMGWVVTKKGKRVELKAKTPHTFNGVKDATRNEKQIKQWWARYNDAAIGVNLGMSELFCVDLDNHTEGINGIENWLKLGISDEGTLKVLTPNKGLHIYFSGQGKTRSNENTGVDCRGGVGSYTILPNSFIFDKEGNKKSYVALTDMSINPKPVSDELFEKLGLIRHEKPNRGKYVSPLSSDEEFKEAERIVWKLPFEVINNYSDWTRIGFYLHKFGDKGKELFIKWTEETYLSVKPNSTRTNLDHKWDCLDDKRGELSIGTLKYYLKETIK